MKNICTAFVAAQKEFNPALKSSTNPHFKSKYADLAACVEAVIDALNNHGIALMQLNHESQGGVTVETMFIHESGETLSSGKLFVPAGKQDPQGFGSALTYARRYSLMAACGIAPEDDDGNNAVRKPQQDSAVAIKYIADSQTLDELKGHYTAAYSIFSADKSAMALITKAKDARKLALTEIKND